MRIARNGRHTLSIRVAFVKQEDRARELMPIVASFTQKSVMHFSSRRGDFPYTRLLRGSLSSPNFLRRGGCLEHVNSVLSALYTIKAPSRYSPCTRQDANRPSFFPSDRTCCTRTHACKFGKSLSYIPSVSEKPCIFF